MPRSRAPQVLAAVLAAALPSCNSLLGEYEVDDRGPAPCTVETADEDCSSGLECDASFDYDGEGVCRRPCSETNPCPAHRNCSSNFCSERIGTSCPFGDCGGGGTCIERGLGGETLEDPYCSVSCDEMDPCPAGYVCDGYCYAQ